MSWTRCVGLACLAASLAAALFAAGCAKSNAKGPDLTPAEKIARGQVVSFTSGCQDCHTPGTFYGAPDTTRTLSGSELGWHGPWGVSYARNLTPDSTTGIGAWTEDQIVNAIRTGHRPDGSVLLPPMPWPSFSRFSDADVHALAAYLKSIPSIRHKMPAAVPPGGPVSGSVLVLPPPPSWDAKNLPISAAPAPTETVAPAVAGTP